GRVDLEGMPEPELPVLETGLLGEVLIEQLADRDGMRCLHRVGGGEGVVLAGVDDDAGACVDLTREPLVDKGSDRVAVAETDAAHSAAAPHAQSPEGGQGGGLRRAPSASIAAPADVAPQLRARLVQCGPHHPGALLSGVGAGVGGASRALWNEVERG